MPCSTEVYRLCTPIPPLIRSRSDFVIARTWATCDHSRTASQVGLLHPVVVTPEGRLIAGQRRLEACLTLGWTEVPVTVVDLYQVARGEAHENLVRKDLLPSEIVALKRAIEPLERREARERQGPSKPRAESIQGSRTNSTH